MAWTLQIDVPANGRFRTATVTAIDSGNHVIYHDRVNMDTARDRKRLADELAKRLKAKPQAIQSQVEERWNLMVEDRRRQQEAPKDVRPGDAGPADIYCVSDAGILWNRPTPAGVVPVPLTNFGATIAADIAHDDGSEVR